MSVDPHWFSTIYGLIFAVTQALSAMAFGIVALRLGKDGTELAPVVTVDRIHDLGKLTFAFVMLWGYVHFSQFLIIWYGNLPEEIIWYVNRTQGGYEILTFAVIGLHLAAPFLLLLSRHPKRNLKTLSNVATGLIGVVWIGWHWTIVPGPLRAELAPSLLDLTTLLLLGGLWVAAFTHFLGASPLLVTGDPRAAEALSDGGH